MRITNNLLSIQTTRDIFSKSFLMSEITTKNYSEVPSVRDYQDQDQAKKMDLRVQTNNNHEYHDESKKLEIENKQTEYLNQKDNTQQIFTDRTHKIYSDNEIEIMDNDIDNDIDNDTDYSYEYSEPDSIS